MLIRIIHLFVILINLNKNRAFCIPKITQVENYKESFYDIIIIYPKRYFG